MKLNITYYYLYDERNDGTWPWLEYLDSLHEARYARDNNPSLAHTKIVERRVTERFIPDEELS